MPEHFNKKTWNGNPNQIAAIEDVECAGFGLLMNDPYTFVNRRIRMRFDDMPDPEATNKNSNTITVSAVEAPNK